MPDGFLNLISAAVTPVVMVSACAVLIMGIGTKHAGLADRARHLATEYRSAAPDSPRRGSLRLQLRTFMHRVTLAWIAHCLLYLSTSAFSGTVLLVLLALRGHLSDGPALGLFVLGTLLLIAALVLEFCELLLAQATLRIEVDEVFREDTPSP